MSSRLDEAGPGEQQSGEAKEQPRRPSVRRLPTAYPPMGQSEALVLRERSMVNGIFGQGEEEGVLKQAGSAGGREPRVRDATTQADGRCSGLSATAAAQKKEAEVNLHGRQKTGHKDRPKNRQKRRIGGKTRGTLFGRDESKEDAGSRLRRP
ncbi:hypothetical protein TESG_08306 [Trichophyton tonsurans CBS 112818]|uniref:Uncharacterized protein n=1 Tax=Trichophyton tonsurans (strain CBS 112818) TaxID=647933 RepID=F2RRI0_TRIT1|nr:hypothetical protein TESG_08306 [Trichophyton tonsurans CBS 112818]